MSAVPRSLTLAIALTGEAPARFDDKTRSWAFSESVAGLLQEGRLEEAESVASASLGRARLAVEQIPESKEALHALARDLRTTTEVAHILGDAKQLQVFIPEYIRVVDQIIGAEAPTIEMMKMRAKARSLAYLFQGPEGLELARAGVVDARKVVASDGKLQENIRLLADCLSSVGQIELRAGEATASLASLDESIALLEQTSESPRRQAPSRFEAEARMLRANAYCRLGRYDEAIGDARLALEQAKIIQDHVPHSIDSARLVSLAWRELARSYRQQGSLVRAMESFTGLRQVAGSMFRSWPQSVWAASQYTVALKESAEAAREGNAHSEAQRWITEALGLTATLIQRLSDDEELRSLHAALLALQRDLPSPSAP